MINAAVRTDDVHHLASDFSYRREPLVVVLFGQETGDAGSIDQTAAQEQTAAIARQYGIDNVFAINPSQFNRTIVQAMPEAFAKHTLLDGVHIHYDVFADGIARLPKGQALRVRSADCYFVTLIGQDDEVAIIHCGRDSLLNQEWKPGREAWKDRASVIQNALGMMVSPREAIRAAIVCGIGPDDYPLIAGHPVHGPHNAMLIERVAAEWGPQCISSTKSGVPSLSLYHVIKAQLQKEGVARDNIWWDGINTATDWFGAPKKFKWFSASRGDKARNTLYLLNP